MKFVSLLIFLSIFSVHAQEVDDLADLKQTNEARTLREGTVADVTDLLLDYIEGNPEE